MKSACIPAIFFAYCNLLVVLSKISHLSDLLIIVFLLQLANTEEYIDGALTGNLGEVLIR